MKIIEKTNNFTKQKHYEIEIPFEEGLDSIEISECFIRQFPKQKCIIKNAKLKKIEIEILFVGLNLKKSQ